MERLFIGGEYVNSTSKKVTTVENPATEEVIAEVPTPTPETSIGRWRPRAAPSETGGGRIISNGSSCCTNARGGSRSTPTSWP